MAGRAPGGGAAQRVAEQDLAAFAGGFARRFLLIGQSRGRLAGCGRCDGLTMWTHVGHGASGLFQEPARAVAETLEVLRPDVEAAEGPVLVMFGGDPARDERPDLGVLVRDVKLALHPHVRVLAVQYWPEVDDHVDYLLQFQQAERDFKPDGRPFYGGTGDDGRPVAASRFYIGDAMLPLLDRVVCVGGGPISLAEFRYAVSKGVPHTYIRARSVHRGWGPVDEWWGNSTSS